MEEKNEIKKGNKILIVTLVLVGLIAIGACVYLLFKGRNGNTKEENQIISNYSQNANNLNEDKNNFEEKEDDNEEAKYVEYMPTSKNCVLYNFSVGSDLIAFEADDPTVMLVGINGDGFAFHFDESVIDFFKSL